MVGNPVSPHFKPNHARAKPAAAKASQEGAYGGFVRMSHEYSVERGSIENHKLEIQRLAAVRGLSLVEWYILPAISGKTIWNQPEVQRMRGDIEAGRIRGIVFSKLARLCRNLKELLEFRDFFQQHDAHMVCPEFNTADATGRLMYSFLGALAEMERENIVERVSASIRPRAQRGLSLGGAAKYGFRWVKGATQPWVLEQVPEEVEVLKAAVRIFLEEQALRPVLPRLNALSKTRKGFEWSDSRLRNLLTDPVYRGTWIRNRTTYKEDERKVYEKDPSAWVEVPIAPIFTPDECRRIDEALAKIKAGYTMPTTRQVYLLSQVWCECGTKVYGSHYHGRRVYLCRECRNQIPVEDLDRIILDEMRLAPVNAEQIARLSRQMEDNERRRQGNLAEAGKLRVRAKETATRLRKLTQLGLELGAQAVKAEVQELHASQGALEARIAELEGEAAALPQIEDVTAFLERVQEIPDVLDRLDAKHRLRLLTGIMPRITLGREIIRFELNFLRNLPHFGGNVQRTLMGSAQITPGRHLIRLDESVFHPQLPFGKRLSAARAYLGLTRDDLAARLKVSKQSILRWEVHTRPPLEKVRPRAEAFIRRAHAKMEARIRALQGGRA